MVDVKHFKNILCESLYYVVDGSGHVDFTTYPKQFTSQWHNAHVCVCTNTCIRYWRVEMQYYDHSLVTDIDWYEQSTLFHFHIEGKNEQYHRTETNKMRVYFISLNIFFYCALFDISYSVSVAIIANQFFIFHPIPIYLHICININ